MFHVFIELNAPNKSNKRKHFLKNKQKLSSNKMAENSLTDAQKARIERNRAKALSLKQSKLVSHPYALNRKDVNSVDGTSSVIKVQGTKYVDSGGGFLIEQAVTASQNAAQSSNATTSDQPTLVDDAISIPVHYDECLMCGEMFADSFLMNNFSHSVCDKCRDCDGEHSLITRTEAKAEYLLKDCDFDKREPPLRYISRKNPHNIRWGEMKLYLHLQVQKRALEVWGSEEELMKQHENRLEKREVGKIRKYNKQMKQLRMEVRSSLYTKKTKAVHVHEFGEDSYNEEEDTYTHTCRTCNFTETYEKM
ncbi:DNA repair protein complementing XP-A cells homolog [Stomoxys calcitrans]|uniref:XPA C-terminal domain-containing protein n=1 Tax=Stomoxys calcitrans TaxID=35570 RepID=A0A1I8NXF5_STOCA|nr:DNA repair protein complementing XP-A cells homolog [Stomoxys calcitrans]